MAKWEDNVNCEDMLNSTQASFWKLIYFNTNNNKVWIMDIWLLEQLVFGLMRDI